MARISVMRYESLVGFRIGVSSGYGSRLRVRNSG